MNIMVPVIYILIIFFVLFSTAKKKAKLSGASQSNPRPAPAKPSAPGKKPPIGKSPFGRFSYGRDVPDFEADEPLSRPFPVYKLDSAHYHHEGYDFETCMSFSDLPAGTDELEYLIKTNRQHEKKLEKLLQVNDK